MKPPTATPLITEVLSIVLVEFSQTELVALVRHELDDISVFRQREFKNQSKKKNSTHKYSYATAQTKTTTKKRSFSAKNKTIDAVEKKTNFFPNFSKTIKVQRVLNGIFFFFQKGKKK
jgi:hypothetical protein